MINKDFNFKQFVIISLITSIWIHIGEIARAVLVAFPMMESFFYGKLELIGAEQMQISHALIWGAWDMLITLILVFIFWLCAVVFGSNTKSILISGTITAFATIGVFWIGSVNSGLGEWSTAFTLIPLAWIELVIGAWVASKLYASKNWMK